jgi:hypothetical protein
MTRLLAEAKRSAPDTAQIIIPPRRALGDNVIEAEGPEEALATGC